MKFKSFSKLLKKVKYPFQCIVEELEDMLLLKMMKATNRSETVSFEDVMQKLR